MKITGKVSFQNGSENTLFLKTNFPVAFKHQIYGINCKHLTRPLPTYLTRIAKERLYVFMCQWISFHSLTMSARVCIDIVQWMIGLVIFYLWRARWNFLFRLFYQWKQCLQHLGASNTVLSTVPRAVHSQLILDQ